MNIGIIGSKNFRGLHKVSEFLIMQPDKQDLLILTADTRNGSENQAVYTCDVLGIECQKFNPFFKTKNKDNDKIVGRSIDENCDFLVVFWSGDSSDYLPFVSAYEYCVNHNKPIIWIFD
jgi:hypothetical protein